MHTLSVVDSSLQVLFDALSERIKERQIESVAPKSTFKETAHTVKSFVLMSWCEEEKIAPLRSEKEPSYQHIDSLGSGYIDLKTNAKEAANAMFNISKGLLSSSRKASVIRRAKQQFFDMTAPQVVNVDEESEQVRNKKMEDEKEYLRLKNAIREKQKEMEDRRERDLKQIEKKTISFDYEGKYIATNALLLPNTKPINLSPDFSNIKNMTMNSKKSVEMAEIKFDNLKKGQVSKKSVKEQYVPCFTDDDIKLTDGLQQIAEGVRISEETKSSQKIVKEKKRRKLSGIKMYRLSEYQNYSKDKKFKEYSKHRRGSSLLELNTIGEPMNIESASPREMKSQMETLPQTKGASIGDALGRRLPFIRTKGFKLYDLGAHRLKDVKYDRRKKNSSVSTIRVDSDRLYEESIFN